MIKDDIETYEDMYAYVQGADFTAYEWSGPKEGDFVVTGFRPVDDNDFQTDSDSVIEQNGESYQKVWFGESPDQPDQYVKASRIDDVVYLIYTWNDVRGIYTAFTGVAYATEDGARKQGDKNMRYTIPVCLPSMNDDNIYIRIISDILKLDMSDNEKMKIITRYITLREEKE